MMERTQFLDKLSLVAPALAANDFIPVMSHFWFSEKHVTAFNDQIAISVPCKSGIVGAVPGATLVALLNASRAKSVELLPEDNQVLVKAASAKVTLGLLPTDAFVFEMPKPDPRNSLKVTSKQFLEGIANCMRSVSHDTSVPDQLGVTLVGNGDIVSMYSTDSRTLSVAQAPCKGGLKDGERVILSAAFCAQLLSLSKSTGDGVLEVHQDHALFVNDKVTLFGRLIESEKPLDYVGVLTHHVPKGALKNLVPMPSKMELILDRAIIIAESKSDRTKTDVTVRDGVMKFISKSDRGEIVDSMQIEPQHPDVTVRLEARLLKAGYGTFDKMLITEGCAIMTRAGGMMYLVSASNG